MEKCEKCGENVNLSKQSKESFSVEIDEDTKEHYFHLRCLINKEPPLTGGRENSTLSSLQYRRKMV